jgi:GNAT superfamily N-acetyltransferase
MIFTDAFWDTRNLGVRTAELKFDANETVPVDEIGRAIEGYEYIVAKVPQQSPLTLKLMQDAGFTFSECQINFRHDLQDLPELQVLPTGSIMTHRLTRNKDVILEQVGNGLFNSDRVFLDPAFSQETAAQRYVHWIEDELERGNPLFDVLVDDELVGFFAYKEPEEHVSYPYLIGLFPEARGRGLGKALVIESLIASKEHGCTASSTHVSSNNPPIIRCQESVGSRIAAMDYVFVKHQ